MILTGFRQVPRYNVLRLCLSASEITGRLDIIWNKYSILLSDRSKLIEKPTLLLQNVSLLSSNLIFSFFYILLICLISLDSSIFYLQQCKLNLVTLSTPDSYKLLVLAISCTVDDIESYIELYEPTYELIKSSFYYSSV